MIQAKLFLPAVAWPRVMKEFGVILFADFKGAVSLTAVNNYNLVTPYNAL